MARLTLLHLSSATLTALTIASINIRVPMCLSIGVISANLSTLPDLCYCCTVYILRHSHHHTQIMRLLTSSLSAYVVLAGPFSERDLREFGDISCQQNFCAYLRNHVLIGGDVGSTTADALNPGRMKKRVLKRHECRRDIVYGLKDCGG